MEPFNEVDKSKSSQPKKSKPSWKAASDDQKLEYNDILFRKLIQETVLRLYQVARTLDVTTQST